MAFCKQPSDTHDIYIYYYYYENYIELCHMTKISATKYLKKYSSQIYNGELLCQKEKYVIGIKIP